MRCSAGVSAPASLSRSRRGREPAATSSYFAPRATRRNPPRSARWAQDSWNASTVGLVESLVERNRHLIDVGEADF
jgi:hypothetical protein